MLYIVADHAGTELKQRLMNICKRYAIPFTDLYTEENPSDDYPDVANILAKKMRELDDDSLGIAICGTAEGMCMALNRYQYIRAAIVHTPYLASIVRRHNHANVMCLAGKYSDTPLSDSMLREIIETFEHTKPDLDERHVRRVAKLSKVYE